MAIVNMQLEPYQLFDSHLHIIDPRFPLVPNQGFLPSPFTVEDYLARVAALNVVGGVVVSGSFQGYDQTYLCAALEKLGSRFFGVTQLPATVSDEQVLLLNATSVRGVRFNIKRGGSENVAHLETLANRIYDLAGWHVELYVDTTQLIDLVPTLTKLPKVSIDHLGLSKEGLDTLLVLVERGVHVKATGFGRVNFDVSKAVKAIAEANPTALMFGTDLPSTRAARAFLDEDVALIMEAVGNELAERILYANGIAFYRLNTPAE